VDDRGIAAAKELRTVDRAMSGALDAVVDGAPADGDHIEVLNADVGASWPAPRRILPEGERGQLYPGERVVLTASGRIDRNHVHREEEETVYLFFKKTKVIDYPQFVDYRDHPLQLTLVGKDSGTALFGPRTLSPDGLTLTVSGDVAAPALLQAFVPNQPVAIDRAASYGAYRLEARVDSAPRLELVGRTLAAARMTAEQIESPNFLNRRLREHFDSEIAAAIVEQYRRFHTNGRDRQAAEAVIQLAVKLAPQNGTARAELANFLIQQGRWEEADQQLRHAVEDLRASASDRQPDSWRQLGEAELRLAQVSEAKAGGLTPQETLNAEFWFGEAGAALERGGYLVRAVDAYREQARILWQLDRSRSASEKARRVLAHAIGLAPAVFDGKLLGVSPSGKWAALVRETAALRLSPVGQGETQLFDIPAVSNVKVIAYDNAEDRVLLSGGDGNYWWRPGTGAAPQRAPGSLGQLRFATAAGGYLLGAADGGEILYAPPGEEPVGVDLNPDGENVSADLTALHGSGFFAAAVSSSSLAGSGDVYVHVFDSQRMLQRRLVVGRIDSALDKLPDNASDEDVRAAVLNARVEVPSQLAIGPAGEVLAFVSNPVNPTVGKWLLAGKAGEAQPVEVPPATMPSAPPPITVGEVPQQNSWYDETSVPGPGPWPETPFYWWAGGHDVRREWSHASFSPDGKSAFVSNSRAGVIEIDVASQAIRRTFPLPALAGAGDGTRFPLGHRAGRDGNILVAWAEPDGDRIKRTWFVRVDPASGRMSEVELSEQQRRLFVDLGSRYAHDSAFVSAGETIALAELVGETLRLADLSANRIAISVPRNDFGYFNESGLVLDNECIVLDRGDALMIANLAAGTRSTIEGLREPRWIPGREWIAGGADGIHRFRDDQQVGFVAMPPSSNIKHMFGRYALVGQGDRDERDLRVYDASGTGPARDFALLAPGELLAFSVDERGTNAVTRRTTDRGRESIWLETSSGQAVLIAEPATPVPDHTDLSRLTARIAAAADGRSFLVLVGQSDIDEGFIHNETLRVTYRLFLADAAAARVQAVPTRLPITEAGLAASDDLSLYVYTSADDIVAVDRTTGRHLAEVPRTGGEGAAAMTAAGLVVPGYDSAVLWTWPAGSPARPDFA
jgi:tetratricopeptide (TPR) repeat protein